MASDDVHRLVELTRPRIRARNETMHRRLGLDLRVLDRTDALLVDGLAAHGPMTRRQLASYLAVGLPVTWSA